MQPSESHALVKSHIAFFEAEERVVMDKLLRYYQGKFYVDTTGESESKLLKTSVNITFALVETALSTLVPKNPQVTCVARNRAKSEQLENVEKVVNLAFDESSYYEELTYGIQDAVLYGRGVFKVTWDEYADLPVVRACDPRTIFFDHTARRPKDIKYWCEVVVLSKAEFRARVESEDYRVPFAVDREGFGSYPEWLNKVDSTYVKGLKNYQPWVTIYEFYDLEAGTVRHFHPDYDQPLFEDKVVYNPFILLTLNNNGADCKGLSEIALISANQEELNNLLSFILEMVRTTIPKLGYDPMAVDENDLSKAQTAPMNSLVPIRTKQNKSLRENVFPFPMTTLPVAVTDLVQRFWDHISFVSALAEAQRGQVTGAKTATELALIEGQLRNRLSARQSRINSATTQIAEVMLLLMSAYMKKEKTVEVTGDEGAVDILPQTLCGVRVKFKVTAYSPMESNRAVLQEQFQKALEFLRGNELVDQEELTREFIRIFGMSPRLVLKQSAVQKAPPAPPMPPPGLLPSPLGVDPLAAAQATGTPLSPAPLPNGMQALADAQGGAPPPVAPPVGVMPQTSTGLV